MIETSPVMQPRAVGGGVAELWLRRVVLSAVSPCRGGSAVSPVKTPPSRAQPQNDGATSASSEGAVTPVRSPARPGHSAARSQSRRRLENLLALSAVSPVRTPARPIRRDEASASERFLS